MNILQETTSILAQEEYLEVLLEAFLIAKKSENVVSGTLEFYRQKLTNFNNFCLSQEIKQVSQIVPSTIREFMLYLMERGNNDGGVHAHFRTVRTFLRWYEKEYEPSGWKNPIIKVKAPKVAVEPLEPANYEDVEKMIKACGNDMVGHRNKAMFHFLLDTGARASEMLKLTLADVDQITGECLIRQGKGRKPRFVFLGEKSRRSLRQYLKLRKDSSHALWITESGSGALSYWGLVSEIKRLSKRAKVKTPSVHSFRRFWALQMIQSEKTDMLSISRLGGWSDMQMLIRYAKQNKSHLKSKAHSPVDNLK